MTNKEINSLITSLLGLPRLYDVKFDGHEVNTNLTLEEANARLSKMNEEWGPGGYILTSRESCIEYSKNIEETLKAISKLAQKDNHTFVLSFEDGEWRAAYGDYKDCEEYRGANPAYCSCMALLKFMGKV